VIKVKTNQHEAIMSYRTVLIYIDMETISVKEFVTLRNKHIMSHFEQKDFVSNIKLLHVLGIRSK
jgi:hypothetical protein